MFKKTKAFLVTVAIICTMAGCSDTSDTPAGPDASGDDARTIKIGMYTYLTGEFANLGQAQQNGAKIAVQQINDAGGINGHKLELIVYDDRASTEMSVQSVTKLVEVDQVDAICSNGLSAAVLATQQITEPAKIIQLCVSPSEKVTNLSPYVFRTFATYDTLNEQNVKNLVDFGVKKVGLIYANTETGISSAEIFTNMIEDAGIDITSEAYNYGDTEYTSQFAKMYKDGAETIFVNMNINEQGLAFKQIRRLGHDDLLFANEGACSPEVRQVGGEAANDVVFSSVNVIPDTIEESLTDIEKKFLTDYEAAYGELPKADLAYRGYDQILVLAEAFRKTQDLDNKEEIRDNFASIKGFEGIQGVYDYTADNGDGLATAKAMAISGGKIITLDKYKETLKK